MPGPLEEHNIRPYLMAFADGELSAADNLLVLDYLAEHPEALELMRGQQRLRIAAIRAAQTLTPAVPDELRRRVEELAATVPPPAPVTTRRSWWARFGGPLGAVAAVFLVIGAMVGRLAVAPEAPVPVAPVGRPPVPVEYVAILSLDHAACSRLDAALHAAGVPAALGELSDAVSKDLGEPNPYPDFSSIGYRYVGAGPCAPPSSETLHLLYYSTTPGRRNAISVFVESNRDQFQLDAGKLYLLSDDRSAFPLFAWRTAEVAYFLIADDLKTAEAALGAMLRAPRPPAIRH